MSLKLFATAYHDLDLPRQEKDVLLALCDAAQERADEYRAWPTIQLLEYLTGFSSRHIRRQLRSLEKQRIIELVADEGYHRYEKPEYRNGRLVEGAWRGRDYRINLDAAPRKKPFGVWLHEKYEKSAVDHEETPDTVSGVDGSAAGASAVPEQNPVVEDTPDTLSPPDNVPSLGGSQAPDPGQLEPPTPDNWNRLPRTSCPGILKDQELITETEGARANGVRQSEPDPPCPQDIKQEEWEHACRCAAIIEGDGTGVRAWGRYGLVRRRCLVSLAEIWDNKGRRDPWPLIEQTLLALRDAKPGTAADIFRALQQYPDGVVPRNGASRVEYGARLCGINLGDKP